VCVAKSYGKLCRRFGQREQVEAQPRSLPDPTGANRLFRPREREKLGPLIAALRLRGEGEADKLVELRARLDAARAALEKLERLGDEGRVSPESQERMRQYYEESIQRYTAGLQAGGTTEEYAKSSGDWRDWRRELLAAERETLLSLRDAGEISPVVMRRIERDLDLQESRFGG
jgi:CPA1 family monovalent cation:H+ antiporter